MFMISSKKLYLAGLRIKSKLGTLGHSDGDPVLHSVADAILGACNMGIGQMFSDKNKNLKYTFNNFTSESDKTN